MLAWAAKLRTLGRLARRIGSHLQAHGEPRRKRCERSAWSPDESVDVALVTADGLKIEWFADGH